MAIKRSIAAFILVLSLAAQAAAGPYENGAAAYLDGRYEAAIRLWQPLADRGHADAQYGLGLLHDMAGAVQRTMSSRTCGSICPRRMEIQARFEGAISSRST